MSKKHPRTQLTNLPEQPRVLDAETLTDVVGGLRKGGGGGGGSSSWTWTPPAGPDDLYTLDDE